MSTPVNIDDLTSDQLDRLIAKIKKWTETDEDFLTHPNQKFCLLKHLKYDYHIGVTSASMIIEQYFPKVKAGNTT